MRALSKLNGLSLPQIKDDILIEVTTFTSNNQLVDNFIKSSLSLILVLVTLITNLVNVTYMHKFEEVRGQNTYVYIVLYGKGLLCKIE